MLTDHTDNVPYGEVGRELDDLLPDTAASMAHGMTRRERQIQKRQARGWLHGKGRRKKLSLGERLALVAIFVMLAIFIGILPVGDRYIDSAGVREVLVQGHAGGKGKILFVWVEYRNGSLYKQVDNALLGHGRITQDSSNLALDVKDGQTRNHYSHGDGTKIGADSILAEQQAWAVATSAMLSRLPAYRPAMAVIEGQGALHTGDLLGAINQGNGIGLADQMLIALGACGRNLRKPSAVADTPADYNVIRDGKQLTVRGKFRDFCGLEWSERSIGVTGRPKILVNHVSGPSLGLASGLAYIDSLTRVDLTGGNVIAATGDIGWYGHVGNIGAVAEKAHAVQASGADVFFVPLGEAEQAEKAEPKLNVIGVSNIKQAVNYLCHNGAYCLGDKRLVRIMHQSGVLDNMYADTVSKNADTGATIDGSSDANQPTHNG